MMNKITMNNNNNHNLVNLKPIKMPSNSSTKSNFSKNISLGTLVLKKDQIKLNKIDNSNNTFRNAGSIINSEVARKEAIGSSTET